MKETTMKKLMIAAGVAAAMTGSVYATKGCKDCGNIVVQQAEDPQVVEVDNCFTEVYNVQFKLKTLASKGVKSGDCQGWCMEQGTRTIDGILWSCCSDCANWAGNQEADWNFQYCLWEKSSKTLFTDGLRHQNGHDDIEKGGRRYTTTAAYVPSAVLQIFSGYVFDTANAATLARDQQIALLNAQFGLTGAAQFRNTTAIAAFAAPALDTGKEMLPGDLRYGYTFRWHCTNNDNAPGQDTVVDSGAKWLTSQFGNDTTEGTLLYSYLHEKTPDGTDFYGAPNGKDGRTWTKEVYDVAANAWNPAVGAAPATSANADFVILNTAGANQCVSGADINGATKGQNIAATTGIAVYSNQQGDKWGYVIESQNGFVPNVRGSDCDEKKALETAVATLPKSSTVDDIAQCIGPNSGLYASRALAIAAGWPAEAVTYAQVPGTLNTTSVADENCSNVDPAERSRYLDTQANIAVYRYGKKADKAEALWVIDTANDAQDGAGLKSDVDDLLLTAAGFGTVAMDKDYEQYYVKSLSGNCAGQITPLNVAADCAGNIISMCDELGSWCTDGWVATIADTFASGTWTMKYIVQAKNGIWGLVPNYAK